MSEAKKHDQGKPMWGLLPIAQVAQVVDVLTFGAGKYAPNQWQHVPDAVDRYYSAMMRHVAAWRMGETRDSESGLHHLAHAACCLLFLIWFDDNGQKGKSWKNITKIVKIVVDRILLK